MGTKNRRMLRVDELDREHHSKLGQGGTGGGGDDREKSRQHKLLRSAAMRAPVSATMVNKPPLTNGRVNGVDVLSGEAVGKNSRSGSRKSNVPLETLGCESTDVSAPCRSSTCCGLENCSVVGL